MILDSGIATIAHKVNSVTGGGKPKWSYEIFFRSWYGETAFSTAARSGDYREDSRVSARIRVLQNRAITNHDVVVLANVDEIDPSAQTVYEVIDAWHGPDDDNREPISNLNLEVIT